MEKKLSRLGCKGKITIVIEGVFYYLSEENILRLISTLIKVFPAHTLICDLMGYDFFQRYAKKFGDVVQQLGAPFVYTPRHPEEVFLKSGYTVQRKVSIASASAHYGRPRALYAVLPLFMRTLREGYNVFMFDTTS